MSLSIGGAPFTLNFGDGIRRITASLPGSGWSWSKRFGRKPDER